MADFGYDVSNYIDVHPVFGSLQDMDRLLAVARARDLRVILDFVPNHSSDHHPWFLESRSSRESVKRDWYIWRDPAPGGGPPTNWISRFDGESAWTWDEHTQQYYLHSFLPEQPDLNWRNPEVRAAMLDVMRFWFDRGVDGFRVDVSYRVMKDPTFRDNPLNPEWTDVMDPHKRLLEVHTKNTPDIHHFNRWLREVADEYKDRVLIGEMNLPFDQLVRHYGAGDEFHLPFNFSLIFAEWDPDAVRALADKYEALLPPDAWPNWVLGNHDQHRIASRIGAAQARVAMMLLLTLRGTPTIYYGDEIGMHDVPIPPDRVQDPWEKNVPDRGFGRDPERTPMQWNAGANAGFCPAGVEPWLPIAADHDMVNVKRQKEQETSMLSLTRALIELRRRESALRLGGYRSLPAADGVFAFERYGPEGDSDFVVALNFSGSDVAWGLPPQWQRLERVLSTYCDTTSSLHKGRLHLRPDEGIILRT
jgi:alpha-glucosidase